MTFETLHPQTLSNGQVIYMTDEGRKISGLGEITADSLPDYDSWGPDSYWGCGDWVMWHKALKAKYGREIANDKFKVAWDKQDSFEHGITSCRYDGDTVSYLLNEGIDIRSFLSAILVPILNAGADVAEGTQNAGAGINDTLNTLKKLLPLAAVALVAGAGYYGYQKYLKNVK